jgi:hypothetical protein
MYNENYNKYYHSLHGLSDHSLDEDIESLCFVFFSCVMIYSTKGRRNLEARDSPIHLIISSPNARMHVLTLQRDVCIKMI